MQEECIFSHVSQDSNDDNTSPMESYNCKEIRAFLILVFNFVKSTITIFIRL